MVSPQEAYREGNPINILAPLPSSEISPVLSRKEFFSPLAVEICPRMDWMIDNGGRRIYQLGSLVRDNVLESFLPNSIVVLDASGQTWRVKHFHTNTGDTGELFLEGPNNQRHVLGDTQRDGSGSWFMTGFNHRSADFIQAAWVVPVGPWGDAWDVMFTDLSDKIYPALNDLPDEILGPALERQSNLIRKFMEEVYPVNWGVCNSAGTLHGQGLMSVLYPHSHIWQFSRDLHKKVSLKPTNIIRARNESLWDGGLSRLFGEDVKKEFEPDLKVCCPDASSITPDNMGFTFHLPGFHSENFNLDFFRTIWTSLSLKIDHQLRLWFARNYLSPDGKKDGDLGKVYDFVRRAHLEGRVDEEAYQGFFRNRKPDSHATEEGYLLDHLEADNLVRYPPGWAAAIQFTPNGAFVAVSFGFLNVPLGGVECLAVELVRPEERLFGEALRRKMQLFGEEIAPIIYG